MLRDVIRRMRQETSPGRGLQVALHTLAAAMNADGAVLLDGSNSPVGTGLGFAAVKDALASMVPYNVNGDSVDHCMANGQGVLLWRLPTRFEETAGLALLRPARPVWDQNDRLLAEAVEDILALVMDHQAIECERACQSRTDDLTGLLNHHAFLEELPRHVGRLERDVSAGTLMLVDIDELRAVNERWGLPAGDRALMCLAEILRISVRPTDLVARLGADDFAVWLNGADHMTAAERAEAWRAGVPNRLADAVGSATPHLTLSIGIATLSVGGDESVYDIMCKAEQALAQVKRDARGNWRVARVDMACLLAAAPSSSPLARAQRSQQIGHCRAPATLRLAAIIRNGMCITRQGHRTSRHHLRSRRTGQVRITAP
ncbi:MAG: GGDEF domain-containing protein [Chloroflexi bacterium]|nr:GGDEF domain-containing protein [Chloroflexota bacterium]